MGEERAAAERLIATFFADYPEQQFSKGQILLHAGEDPTHIFYLTAGLVRQYDVTPDGAELVLNTFKPGTFFPMSYVFTHAPNAYLYDALQDVRLRQAPIEAVYRFVREQPAVALDLLARVYTGTDGLLRKLAELMGGTAESRLIQELITLAKRFGESDGRGGVTIRVHEAQLAAQTGLTRETVNRCLRTLKGGGEVTIGHGTLYIQDLALLESRVDRAK